MIRGFDVGKRGFEVEKRGVRTRKRGFEPTKGCLESRKWGFEDEKKGFGVEKKRLEVEKRGFVANLSLPERHTPHPPPPTPPRLALSPLAPRGMRTSAQHQRIKCKKRHKKKTFLVQTALRFEVFLCVFDFRVQADLRAAHCPLTPQSGASAR